MTTIIDRIVIAVPDLIAAQNEYKLLLGVEALEAHEPGVEQRVWFALTNTVIELRQQPIEEAAICGLVFANTEYNRVDSPLSNPFNLPLQICDGQQTALFRRNQTTACSGLSVDHIVLQTLDADACVTFFTEQLGIRLALDKTVPKWGGRMLFFRTGKLTLEVSEAYKGRPEKDYFWGIALQCKDIETTSYKLEHEGVALSKVRVGRKPGTRVASVKSHALGIPTLLIEPVTA